MDDPPSLLGTPREWAKDLTTATLIGVFLGVIGPFGSFYGAPVEIRIVYWVANLLIGFIVIATVVRLSIRVAIRFDLPVWFALAVGVAIGCLPLGLIIALFSAAFWPGNHGRLSSLYVWYGQTLAISEPFSFAFYALRDRSRRSEAGRAEPCAAPDLAISGVVAPQRPTLDIPETGGSAFLNRLPPRLGRDLLALQMEDHYVRAHTEKGSDLILTSLKDAIAELQEVEGMQVHRSWWVARRAVQTSAANGRNLSLRLINGLEAPVSRPTVAKLKAAGWINTA